MTRSIIYILLIVTLLPLVQNSFAQQSINSLSTDIVYYPSNNKDYDNRNRAIVNRIFGTNYLAFRGSNPGNINGEYRQMDGYNTGFTVCREKCTGQCQHTGIDYRARSPFSLYSLIGGEVTAAGADGSGTIAIYNASLGVTLLYLHCSESNVLIGQTIRGGELVGKSGDKGAGPFHFHLELRKGRKSKGGCLEDSPTTNETYDPRIVDDLVPAPVNLTDQPLFVSNINWSAILFRWQKCYQATGYVIQIASSVTFSSGSIVAEITTGDVNSFNWTGGESSKQYFWRVRGNHKTNFDEHDHVREILTQPAKPILEAPLAGAANISAPKYTFNWSDIPGPNAVYRFQISTDPKLKQTDVGLKDLYQFPLLGSTDKLTESKWTLYSLKPNTKYYWRVRGANNKGISAYSYGEFTTGSFTTANDEKLTEIYVDNKYVATVPSKNDQELELPTGNITPGYHTVSVRFKEGTNNWSSFTSKKFLHLGTKANSISSTPNQVEYWFNNDFAGRKSAPLAGTGNQEIQFDTKDLDQGQHTVFWRTRAKGDLWSSVVSSTFRKSAKSDGISQMEYWFNNGFDRRKQKTVSNFAQVEEDLDITDLPLGNHRLFYRFQHAGGKWSAINTADYNKRTGFETGPLQMQYWFDSAVGVPNSLVVSTANEGDFGLSAHHLDSGWHKVFIRFRKSGGLWSSLISNRFYKQDSAIATCDFVAASDSEAVAATKLFCQMGILRAGNTECVSTSDYYFKRKDVASLTMRALVGHPDAFPFAKPLPSLFGDLQEESTTNSCYFSAAKLLSYLDFGDGIAPFNGSRLNFNPNDTIVRGYALKVLMEAWDIKPDASLHNPFSDLVPGAEVNGYILKAAQLGLVKRPDLHGSAFSSFRPFRAVSREEFFIMLYRVLMTASRPEVRFSDLYLPFNRTNIAGRNPGISEGNFSSYREEPFILRGVPGLNFNFNYNSSLLELPESAAKGRNWQGKLLYDKEPLGKGWTHNYNAYIVVDIGNDDINSVDDRWMMVWPGGNIHVYQPQQAKYLTHGVYDKVSYSGGVGAIPEQIVVTMKNQVKYVFHKLAGSPTGELLHLIRIEDRHGNAVSLDYENGFSENDGINIKRLMKVSDPQGRNFTFSYADQSNRIIGIASKAGNIERSISFTYNGSRLIKYANPKGYETTYNYGLTPATEHLIYSIVLPRGNTITNTYSTNRKIQSTAYTNGSKTIVDARPEYTVNGIRTKSETTTIVDGRTIKRSVVLNDIGALVSSKGPLQDDSIAYGDSRHRTLPTYIEDRIKEVITRIEYDANGNQTRTRVESSGTALETRTTFNDKNDVLSQTDARGNSTTYQYNGTGQLTEMRAPIGTTVFTPNTNGTVSQVTNPAGIATQYSYDLYGNQIMARLPLQIESRQEWDSASRMIAKWDARGAKTERQYDVHDNLELETFDPNGLNEKTTYRYDKNDNLLEIENAKGNITYLSYNNEDQMVKQQFGEYSKQFDYHNDGRLKSLTTPNNARFNYRYNNNGQLQGDGYAAYGYYPDGMLQTITKNGQSLTYRYDAFGRVAQTSYSDFPGNSVSYEYDANGNTSRIRYPGGFAVRYNYDANNVLKQVTDDGGAAWVTYQYLDDGRLSMATNKNGTISKYFYDDAGRMDSLVNLKGNGEVIASYGFEMDKVGNHTEERFLQPLMQMIPQFSRTDTFTYNSINRFLTRNEEKFEYDPNGNLTNHTIPGSDGKYYVWDTKDNLLRFEEDGQLISYDYDGLEQRRRRNEVRYVLDNNYNVLMETDLDGNPLYYYVQGLGLVSRIKANTQETGYYHYDYRGSTVAITNTAQEITHQYNYDAFGVLQQAVEDDFNAYRYVGKYGVAYESKDLTFMRARYYQPSVGRFLSEDPIWAVNLYPYGDNNPISRIDPNGKFWKEVILGTVVVAGGVALVVYGVPAIALAMGGAIVINSTLSAGGAVAIGAIVGAAGGAVAGGINDVKKSMK